MTVPECRFCYSLKTFGLVFGQLLAAFIFFVLLEYATNSVNPVFVFQMLMGFSIEGWFLVLINTYYFNTIS